MVPIREMNNEEIKNELITHCLSIRNCKKCKLSAINHFGDEYAGHRPLADVNDRYLLTLQLAIARGYLVWDESKLDLIEREGPEDPEKTGSNVPEQPTVPPMPEPVEPVKTVECVETVEAKVSELSVNMPEDMTVIMISGKKPTSMTVFYDQEGGGTDGA